MVCSFRDVLLEAIILIEVWVPLWAIRLPHVGIATGKALVVVIVIHSGNKLLPIEGIVSSITLVLATATHRGSRLLLGVCIVLLSIGLAVVIDSNRGSRLLLLAGRIWSFGLALFIVVHRSKLLRHAGIVSNETLAVSITIHGGNKLLSHAHIVSIHRGNKLLSHAGFVSSFDLAILGGIANETERLSSSFRIFC